MGPTSGHRTPGPAVGSASSASVAVAGGASTATK